MGNKTLVAVLGGVLLGSSATLLYNEFVRPDVTAAKIFDSSSKDGFREFTTLHKSFLVEAIQRWALTKMLEVPLSSNFLRISSA